MYKQKIITIKPVTIKTDYINAKRRFANFGIKRKNLCQKLFTRTKHNTKHPIKKMLINHEYNFTKY